MSSTPLSPLIGTKPAQRSRMWPALQAMLEDFNLRNENLLPCEVISYDRTNNVVTVQPLIQLVTTTGKLINRGQYAQIPAMSLGAGGFFINFPIAKGNLGWILASDRDLGLFRQTMAMSAPNSKRCHKFEDGWFIPDVFRNYTINSADADAMVISSVDGTTRIAISEGVINITAPTSMKLDTPAIHATGNLTVDENVSVGNGATGTVPTGTGQTLTIQDGIVTNIY